MFDRSVFDEQVNVLLDVAGRSIDDSSTVFVGGVFCSKCGEVAFGAWIKGEDSGDYYFVLCESCQFHNMVVVVNEPEWFVKVDGSSGGELN